jgi:hypothetical protein
LEPDQFGLPDDKAVVAMVWCPYGRVGDVLWVREGFYKPTADSLRGKYYYKADLDNHGWGLKWKPSIHMPKEACRIFLKIKSIRVENLQDITEEDAIAEGVESWIDDRLASKPTRYKVYYHEDGDDSIYSSSAKISFETLWQSINGPASYYQNPWVWVIEFERIERPANWPNV